MEGFRIVEWAFLRHEGYGTPLGEGLTGCGHLGQFAAKPDREASDVAKLIPVFILFVLPRLSHGGYATR
jgi:hypothetical protein